MLEFRDVSYAYPGVETPVVRGVDLSLAPGEHLALAGANGSGKTTIARLANALLIPHAGSVALDGEDSRESAAIRARIACKVGLVRQDPATQIVSSTVLDEVAFGPCNLGLPEEEVLRRVEHALEVCGITHLRDRSTEELSGGEEQLLALAGVLAMEPDYLVLDEASSHLDDETRARVRAIIGRCREAGVGILEITHRLDELLGADRIMLLEEGSATWSGTPSELLESDELLVRLHPVADTRNRLLIGLARMGFATDALQDPARLVAEARERGVVDILHSELLADIEPETAEPEGARPELRLDSVSKSFHGNRALDGLSFNAPAGQVTLVLGRPGVGKSTALKVASGVLEPDGGAATLAGEPVRIGEVGLAFQRPEEQLFCKTVLDDVMFGPLQEGDSPEQARAKAERALDEIGFETDRRDSSPFTHSGGQARRVALAGIAAGTYGAYVFDEPTSGLDGYGWETFLDLVDRLVDEGVPVVVVSHDASAWLDIAEHAVLIGDGRTIWAGDAAELRVRPELFERAGLVPPAEVRLRAELLADGEVKA